MSDKANVLSIYGADSITLSNPKATVAGFHWNGVELVHGSGKTLRFTPEVTAEIASAVATARKEVRETKTGAQIEDGDRGGWQFSHTQNDAIGIYIRVVSGAVATSVAFAKEDLA